MLKDDRDVKYAGMYYNFEIFHMMEKQVPVDSVEVSYPAIKVTSFPFRLRSRQLLNRYGSSLQ